MVACASLLLGAYRLRECVVDDAYIGFRHVENFVAGRGLQFNPGERVEGVSNVGWLLLLIPVARLLAVPVAAKALGVALALATVCVTYLLALRLSDPASRQLLALPIPLLLATQPDFVYFSLTGMETALLALILCVCAYLALVRRRPYLVAALCAFSYLLHPECLLLYPVFLALAGRGALRQQLGPAVCFVALLGAFTVARLAYYGDWLPNTFYSKPTSLASLFTYAQDALVNSKPDVPAPFQGVLALPFLAYGAWCLAGCSRGAGAFLGATLLVGLVFCVYARPDWTQTGRYFAPYAPLALVVLWVGLVEAHRQVLGARMAPRSLERLLMVYAVLLVGGGLFATANRFSPDYLDTYPGYVLAGRSLLGPARWMRDSLPPGCTIATQRLGALGYVTGRNIFDWKYGLTDRAVARLVRANRTWFETPGAAGLDERWRQVRPDYLLEELPFIEHVAKQAGGTTQRFRLHGMTYHLARTFRIGKEAQWALCARDPSRP